MSELDRLREQLVYLRFWLGIMVATEIALVGWLISTPINANPTLWFIGAFGAVLLGAGIFLLHRQIERRIDQIGKLQPWSFSPESFSSPSWCFSSASRLTLRTATSAFSHGGVAGRGRNPLGLRFLRRFRLARTVEGDRLANERLEGGLVNFFSFVDVDRAACV